MKHTNKCPKCGSSDVIADAKAIDRSPNRNEFRPDAPDLTVATFRKPDAVLFKGQQNTTLSAWVCAECGFVEFYADSPKTLKVATA
jgi:predicted nucleic-acid-binding Zn-ribbon protein